MGRAATSADRSASAMKESQLHIELSGQLMQCVEGLVELPGAGDHSAILIRVGIAQHDLLPRSPRLQQRIVLRIGPHLAHDLRRMPQRLDGFEKGDWHEARIILGAGDAEPCQRGQPNHCKDVPFGFCAADDVRANHAATSGLLFAADSSHGFEQLGGSRRQFRRKSVLGACCFPGDFVQSLRMNAGMLADIERVQLESEAADFKQNRINDGMGESRSAVLTKALAHQQEIVLKFMGRGISPSVAGIITKQLKSGSDNQ